VRSYRGLIPNTTREIQFELFDSSDHLSDRTYAD
jgi:hypothetical protein